MKIYLLFAIFHVILGQIYVDPNSTCSNCNGSLTAPFKTLESAILSNINNEIVLMNGVHFVQDLLISSRSVSLKSQMGPGITSIDGNSTFPCLRLVSGSFTLNGISIQNCRRTSSGGFSDGGAALQISSASVSLYDVWLMNNTVVSGAGGAVSFVDGSFFIYNSQIKHNDAKYGGGIYAKNANLNIAYTFILENNAESLGGGIVMAQGTMTITSAILRNTVNSTNSQSQTAAAIENATILFQTGSKFDGGFYCADSSIILDQRNNQSISLCNDTNINGNLGNILTVGYLTLLILAMISF